MSIFLDRRSATEAFLSLDPRFQAVLGEEPRLERLVGFPAHEGPVYAADEHALYFTTPPTPRPEGPHVSIQRLDLATLELDAVVPHANAANGMALAQDGRLVVCEQGSFGRRARISLVDRSTGASETVCDSYRGRPLSSPNDVIVARDGAIWFTDPCYGHLQGFRPEPRLPDQVYRHDPRTGETTVVATGFDKPNGLALSPDERVLYVGDNGAPTELLAVDLATGERRRVADCTPGHPDGLKVDAEGRIYASAQSGIHVFDPDGTRLGEIALPGAVIFTFGGPERDVLYVTRDDSIWAAHLDAKGA